MPDRQEVARVARSPALAWATGGAPLPGDGGELPSAGETVERPEGGLARGRWEAPRWAFWVVAVATLVGGLAWLAVALRTRRGAR